MSKNYKRSIDTSTLTTKEGQKHAQLLDSVYRIVVTPSSHPGVLLMGLRGERGEMMVRLDEAQRAELISALLDYEG